MQQLHSFSEAIEKSIVTIVPVMIIIEKPEGWVCGGVTVHMLGKH